MGELRNFIDVLTDNEVQKLHEEALCVLEKVGMRVPHKEVLELCRKAGFVVDIDSRTVRFPAKLVNELIEVNRPNVDFTGPVKQMFGNVSTQVFIVDYPGDVRRKGTLADVRKGILVTDKLLNIYNSSAVVIPADYPADRTDLVSYREICLYSKRPGGTYILSPETGRGIIEMTATIGQKSSYLLETVSPLGFMNSSLEMALTYAKAQMPVYVAPMVIAGATGPMSIWGTAVLEIAEITGTNLIIYAMSGIFQNFISSPNHTLDMRTMLCSFGSPNQALLGMIAGQMGRFYGWGANSNSALSDAVLPNYQCGFEKAFSGLLAMMSGTCGIGAQGIVGADQGISLEQLVLDNDWLDAYKHIAHGVEYDAEALGVIEDVGIAGNYMAEDHTVEHMKEVIWNTPSGTFWRDQWEPWKDKGMSDLYGDAHERVLKDIDGWETIDPVVTSSQADEIERIYQRTIKELDAKKR